MNLVAPIYPEVALALLALATLVAESIRPFRSVSRLGVGLALVPLLLLVATFVAPPPEGLHFSGTFQVDAFALFFKRIFLFSTSVVLVLASEFSPRLEHGVAEHYVLLLLAATGMLVLASVTDFILLFVALELVTICFLVLCSHHRRQLGSIEAGAKYLVMGGLASGLLVYGISYIFGVSGATGFADVAQAIRAPTGPTTALSLGVLLVLLGLGFKIAVVPGQLWAPDVYQGAPMPATAFLATGSKIAGFALLLRLLFEGLVPARGVWATMTVYVAGLTILYGNLGGLGQRDLKRMLGYSSIAHSGYLLLGVVAASAMGLSATLFYLAQYALSGLAGFLVLAAVERAGGRSDLASIAGLHRRSPLLAAGLAVSMLSLAGIPPLSGFFGKFLLFAGLLQGKVGGAGLALAGVAAAGVVVSFVYYFSVVRALYAEPPAEAAPIQPGAPLRIALAVCVLGVLVLGVWQAPLLEVAQQAAERLAGLIR